MVWLHKLLGISRIIINKIPRFKRSEFSFSWAGACCYDAASIAGVCGLGKPWRQSGFPAFVQVRMLHGSISIDLWWCLVALKASQRKGKAELILLSPVCPRGVWLGGSCLWLHPTGPLSPGAHGNSRKRRLLRWPIPRLWALSDPSPCDVPRISIALIRGVSHVLCLGCLSLRRNWLAGVLPSPAGSSQAGEDRLEPRSRQGTEGLLLSLPDHVVWQLLGFDF